MRKRDRVLADSTDQERTERAKARPAGYAWGELAIGVGFVALLTVVFFSPVLSGNTLSNVPSAQQLSAPWLPGAKALYVYPQSDQAQATYPWTAIETRAWRTGTIPFWNPYNLGGLPLLTNGQAGVLYPPRILLALLVSPAVDHDLFVLMHIFAAGVFMFLLMKELRLRLFPSLLGAAGWMFASWNSGLMQIEVTLAVTTWFPAALFLIHRGFRTRSWRTSVAAGIPLGLMAIGGQLVLVAFAVFICGAYSVALALAPALERPLGRHFDPRRLVHPVLTLGVGGGLGAVTLLTTFLNANQGGRAVTPYPAFVQTHILTTSEFRHVFSGGPAIPPTLLFSGVFVGLVPLFLAFVGLVRRRPGVALGRWLAVATFLFAVGAPVIHLFGHTTRPVTWFAYHFVPGASRLSSTGYVLWVFDFGVLVLAAVGLDGILDWSGAFARRLGRHQFGPTRDVSDAIARPPRLADKTFSNMRLRQGMPSAGQDQAAPPRSRQLRRSLQLRTVILSLAPLVAIGAVGATSWQLIDYARYVNPPFSKREASNLFPATPAIAAVRADSTRRAATTPQRLIGLNAITGDESAVFPFEDSDGYDSVVPSRVRSLWRLISGYSVSDALGAQRREALLGFRSGSSESFITSFQASTTRFALLARVGVTTVVASPSQARQVAASPQSVAPIRLVPIYAGPDASVFNIAGEQPRAWVVHRADVVRSAPAALDRFADPTFDYQNRMIVETDQGVGTVNQSQTRGAGRGEVAKRDPIALNRAGFTVQAKSPGWLVMADMHAPGWHVTVNGRDAKLLRADYTLRAVAVPAGRTRVELTYRPPGFGFGLIVSGITILGLLFVAALALRARRLGRRQRSQSADVEP